MPEAAVAAAAEDTRRFKIEVVLEQLEKASSDNDDDVELGHFIAAYEELNKFVGLLGKIFHFVQMDVSEKTSRLHLLREKRPDSYRSVKEMIAYEDNTKHYPGAKALLCLHRALEFMMSFMNALADCSNDLSLAPVCRKCYDETLSRYHNWVVRKTVWLAAYTLPCRNYLLVLIHGSMPCEEELREVLSNVLSISQVVYSLVDSMYSQHNLHSLI